MAGPRFLNVTMGTVLFVTFEVENVTNRTVPIVTLTSCEKNLKKLQ